MFPYASVQDARDAGVTVLQATDERLEDLLEAASNEVEDYTRQFFHPRRAHFLWDGHDHYTLNLSIPLIELEEIEIRSGITTPGFNPVQVIDVVVYNRDKTRGQISTSDDGAPRLKLLFDTFWTLGLQRFVWPRGQQNIDVLGTWGRVEPVRGYVDTALETFVLLDGDDLQLRIDGEVDDAGDPVVQNHAFVTGEFQDISLATSDEVSDALNSTVTGLLARSREVTGGRVARLQSVQRSFSSRVEVVGGTAAAKLGLDTATEVFFPHGQTPAEITKVTVLLVKRALGFAGSSGIDPGDPGPVKKQRTRSQDVEFVVGTGVNQHQSVGSITGDPVIDNILARYTRRATVSVPQSSYSDGPYP